MVAVIRLRCPMRRNLLSLGGLQHELYCCAATYDRCQPKAKCVPWIGLLIRQPEEQPSTCKMLSHSGNARTFGRGIESDCQPPYEALVPRETCGQPPILGCILT